MATKKAVVEAAKPVEKPKNRKETVEFIRKYQQQLRKGGQIAVLA